MLSQLDFETGGRQTILIIIVSTITYAICLVIYRLYFHPLSKFPGPKIAAATQLYEFYFDVVKGGQYIWETKRLHSEYGPIVRVTPDELHVIDPDFLDNIYAGWGRPRDKMHFHVSNIPNTLFGCESHDDHRIHRGIFSPFFSKQSIRKVEPFITAKAARLVERLDQHRADGRVVNMTYALFAWSCDTISKILFDEDWQHIEHADFNQDFADASMRLIRSFKFLTHVKWLTRIALSVPPRVVRLFARKLALPLEYKPRIKRAVAKMMDLASHQQGKWARGSIPTNILSHVYRDSSVPASFKTLEQLSRDAELLVGAGEGSVSGVVLHTFAYLHLFPRTLHRLHAELKVVADGYGKRHEHLTWAECEQLPYFTACIKEGLRLQHGLTKRMPRIAPTEDLVCGDMVIPRGTPMSTMAPLINLNPDVFPDPNAYVPERWLSDEQLSQLNADLAVAGFTFDTPTVPRNRSISYMHSKLMSFSRGSRICLGMELAWAEMYLCLSVLLRSFDFELYETDITDVELFADKILLASKPGSQGIRARVLQRHDVAFAQQVTVT